MTICLHNEMSVSVSRSATLESSVHEDKVDHRFTGRPHDLTGIDELLEGRRDEFMMTRNWKT